MGKVYTFAWATHGAVPTDWYRFNISIQEVGVRFGRRDLL